MKSYWYFIYLLFMALNGQTQLIYHDYGFEKYMQIPVSDNNNLSFNKAWCGGLNSCQFGSVDMNQDGINDLLVFDRNGNRILPFINNGIPNTISYTYHPEYAGKFPYLHDWVEFTDYNCDGKQDIFTYSTGGIAVYRNESSPLNGLLFKLETPLLKSLQGSYYTNIFVTSVDYPALSDIDNDGDLDILTFFGLGSYVEYHKNLSKELYGNCDSLKYQLSEYCWGKFSESTGSNRITLNITCPYQSDFISAPFSVKKDDIKHTGSTLMAIDLDGDTDKDLVIGDVDYPNLIALTNGGNPDNANMISQDTMFPSNMSPVHLFSFPSASYLDLNNDNKKDLLVSPFDGNVVIAENKNSVWMYTNSGSNASPVFNYQMSDFLQNEMIDVGTCAYPVLFDYDGDGLTDLFVGNYGYRDTSYYQNGYLITRYKSELALFRNVGTLTSPQFKLVSTDYANVSSQNLLGIYPAFGDIDNDGKAEMIIGNSDGKLLLYKNIASIGSTPNFILQQANYQNIDVGDYSTPQLIDLDRDHLLDLVIGEKGYRKGNLNYYKNTGTSSIPVFTLITDSLGRVDVCDHATSNYGYSIPCFFEDTIGKYKLFVGSESGHIHYYKNIENHLSGSFEQKEEFLLYIYEGARVGIAVDDLDNDGFMDMIVGNYAGGLSYYKGSVPLPQSIGTKAGYSPNVNVVLYPNPAYNEIDFKVDYDKSISRIEFIIYSISGHKIFSSLYYNENNQIDISGLSAGIYIIHVVVYDEKGNPFFTENEKLSVIK